MITNIEGYTPRINALSQHAESNVCIALEVWFPNPTNVMWIVYLADKDYHGATLEAALTAAELGTGLRQAPIPTVLTGSAPIPTTTTGL